MLVFRSPHIVGGSLDFSLARRSTNKYVIIFARSYGMAATRVWAVLNSTTPSSEQLVLSADNRPCVWLDSDLDRDRRNLGPPEGILASLLVSDPPAIRTTGRKKTMYAPGGGEREAVEVEILLSEDELARFCYYCGTLESLYDDFRFERCGGEGHTSSYWCPTCASKSTFTRFVSTTWKNLW